MVRDGSSSASFPCAVAFVAGLVVAAAVCGSGCGSRKAAQQAGPTAEAVVAAARAAIASSACADALESGVLAAAADAERVEFGPLQWLSGLAPDLRKALSDVVSTLLTERKRQLTAENERLSRFIDDELVPAWSRCAAARIDQAGRADEAERDARKSQQTALALGTENRWFWLAGLVAVAALLAVFALDRRHEIRRYLNGGRARDLGLGKLLVAAFGLICLLTAALFFASDGLLVDLLDRGPAGTHVAAIEAERERDAAAAAAAATRHDKQIKAVEVKKKDMQNSFRTVLPASESEPLFEEWWAFWEAASERRAMLAEIKACEERFAACRIAVDPGHAGSVAADITSNLATAGLWRRRASVTCGFIGIGLLTLVAGGFLCWLWGLSRRTRELAETCPLCLARGTLEPIPGGAGTLQCRSVTSESECKFSFPARLRSLPKLCFPTLGVTGSGKTLWLAMVYRQIKHGQGVPPGVEFSKVRSDASVEFDEKVNNIILNRRDVVGNKPFRLPDPLVFNCVDRDPLGFSNLLVNIFDYSGEVFQRMTLEDRQRRRAFTADGYLFFIDPTQKSHAQLEPLERFKDDVFEVKELRAGQQIQCPVALCVPKIDKLTENRYSDAKGGDPVDFFYRELAEIGWGMDQQSIQARSKLMRNLRDTIWSDWEIERSINNVFDGRYMFFPFTPVGLDGMGEDWTAGNRVIAPVGILHPLMWLIHMNGYPVLPRTAVG